MLKTNKVIYPFKINLQEINVERLKTDFAESKMYNNFKDIPDSKCGASLSFLLEKEGILFFSLSKCDNHNITIADFQQKRDLHSFLPPHQKVKRHSLFAIIPECNVLLVLYDYGSFRYLIPTLNKYFKIKINKEFLSIIMTRDYNDEDIKEFSKNAKQIIIQKARETPIVYSNRTRGSSRRKLKEYIKRNKEVIQFYNLRGVPANKIMKIIKLHLNKNIYDKIIINTKNMGDFDILDEYVINFKCDVNTDEDNLSKIEDFQKAIKEINKKYHSFFNNYQLPS